jgi:hypothetical protein
VFGNKGYLWKLGATLALIAGMGVLAARRGDKINPALWRCVVEPDRWNDTTLWLPIARILSVGESDFEVAAGDARIRVVGRAPAGVDSVITLRGIFRADGPRIEMLRSRVMAPDHARRRLLLEGVSVVVLLGVIANFLRHFLFRPKVLQFERGDK